MTLTKITPEHLRSWGACYSDSDIASLYAGRESLSPVEVLDLDVPVEDRLWVVLRPEVLGERDLRLAVCDLVERVLPIYEAKCPGDTRPRRAIEMSRRFARGEATREGLGVARVAAENAAMAVVWDAARAAERLAQVAIVRGYLERGVSR